MASLEELNPRKAFIKIKGKVYEFEPFSLKARVWAHYEFQEEGKPNGLANLSEKFQKFDLIACSRVLYYLLSDKTDFKSEEEFVKTLNNEIDAHIKINNVIINVFGLSEIHLSEAEKEIQRKKELAAETKN